MAEFETDERALRNKYLANFSEVLVQLGDLLAEKKKIVYIIDIFFGRNIQLVCYFAFWKTCLYQVLHHHQLGITSSNGTKLAGKILHLVEVVISVKVFYKCGE